MDNQLIELKQYYEANYSSNFNKKKIKELYKKFIEKYEAPLLDAAAATAAINGLFLSDAIDFDAITPQMEEAFRLAFPSTDINSLISKTPEELQGYLNAWKGKYFEVLIKDKLNAGEWIGDIHLEAGQYAELASSPTQAGWDLQIFNDDGTIAETLQMKASDSLSYISKALEKYPDINVITTTEIFNNENILNEHIDEHIINSGISNEELTETITDPVESLMDSDLTNFVEDILPGLPFLIITFSESYKVLVGKKSFELAKQNTIERFVKTTLSMAAGSVVYALDGGILSLPTAFLTRIGFDRNKIYYNIYKKTCNKMNEIKQLDKYRMKLLPKPI